MKTSADTSTRTNVQPDDDVAPSLLMEDWANKIERRKAWVDQLKNGLEAEGMTSAALRAQDGLLVSYGLTSVNR